ncbi:hypothetical protein ACLOJK_031246 [Asimina triloba]
MLFARIERTKQTLGLYPGPSSFQNPYLVAKEDSGSSKFEYQTGKEIGTTKCGAACNDSSGVIPNGSLDHQLISGLPDKEIGRVPTFHHMHCDGDLLSTCDVHVIIYDQPTCGKHHFSLNSWKSSEHVEIIDKRPNWIDELLRRQPLSDLDTVFLALNCATAAKKLFNSVLLDFALDLQHYKQRIALRMCVADGCRKWNPLRQRLDSYEYNVEQHVVGSLLFTPLLLLLPTTTVFYIFFSLMNVAVSFISFFIEVTISVLHATPYAEIFLWTWRPKRFPSGVWFQLLSDLMAEKNHHKDTSNAVSILHSNCATFVSSCRTNYLPTLQECLLWDYAYLYCFICIWNLEWPENPIDFGSWTTFNNAVGFIPLHRVLAAVPPSKKLNQCNDGSEDRGKPPALFIRSYLPHASSRSINVAMSLHASEEERRRQPQTLVEAALQVLTTADPVEKARLGEAAAKRWLDGAISQPYDASVHLPVPDRPSRLSNVKLLSPQLMPKLGKAGSLQSRQAILHSLVHTESWAIDLSWDIIARFGQQEAMPVEFFTDFVRVAQDEGRHFTLLAARLQELGSCYGAFPAHDGLWDSAIVTSKSLLARLAVEHCVHEVKIVPLFPAIWFILILVP